MTNSRRKGAAFERDIAKELFAELGIKFKRNLEQYQTKDLGDLTAVNCPEFPFTLELKNCKKITMRAWEAQVFKAAEAAGNYPALIYKQRVGHVVVRVWFDALAKGLGGYAVSGQYAELSIQGFAYLCRELLADQASSQQRKAS